MWELVLSKVPVKWRVIYMNKHHLLYVPGDPLWLPINNGETFRAYWVCCRVAMVVNKGWGPKMSLEPVPKGSAWIPYIFLWTIDVWAFKSIYDSTLFKFAVFGGHKEVLYSVNTLEMYLDSQGVACPFEPFPQSMGCKVPLLRCSCCCCCSFHCFCCC